MSLRRAKTHPPQQNKIAVYRADASSASLVFVQGRKGDLMKKVERLALAKQPAKANDSFRRESCSSGGPIWKKKESQALGQIGRHPQRLPLSVHLLQHPGALSPTTPVLTVRGKYPVSLPQRNAASTKNTPPSRRLVSAYATIVVGSTPGCSGLNSCWMEVAMFLKNGSASASIEPRALGTLDPPQVRVIWETTVLCIISKF